MARSLTVIGAGYGSDPDKRAQFLRDTEVMARRFEELGTPEAITTYQIGPARVQLQNKDPRGFKEFCEEFAEHSALGSANTLRGVQARRPTIYSLARGLARMKVPTHIISGDEDNQCLEPGVFIKRVVPGGAADGGARDRARREHRGARSLQPHHRRVPVAGGLRPLAAARSALAQQVDDGKEIN